MRGREGGTGLDIRYLGTKGGGLATSKRPKLRLGLNSTTGLRRTVVGGWGGHTILRKMKGGENNKLS